MYVASCRAGGGWVSGEVATLATKLHKNIKSIYYDTFPLPKIIIKINNMY